MSRLLPFAANFQRSSSTLQPSSPTTPRNSTRTLLRSLRKLKPAQVRTVTRLIHKLAKEA